jgi:hypothetical protein
MNADSPDARAAAAAAQAQRLRQAAAVNRRLSRGLQYHPATGQRPPLSPGLSSALEEIEQTIIAVGRAAGERDADERALAAAAPASAAEAVRAGHAAVDQGAQVALAALAVLRELLQHRDGASVDAPYGRGAPTRHHPGALATMVAERAEDLALALETVTITKANLYRSPQAQIAAASHLRPQAPPSGHGPDDPRPRNPMPR